MDARIAAAAALVVLVACNGGEVDPPASHDAGVRDSGPTVTTRDAGPDRDGGERDAGVSTDAGFRDGGRRDAGPPPRCLPAQGAVTTRDVSHDGFTAAVTIERDDPCARQYALSTTQPLRDHPYGNPRAIAESANDPVLRSGDVLLDALYALAHLERHDASVDKIVDFAFDRGAPIDCPSPGCFETGRLWTFVWTRDSAYAADLGLAFVDPPRMQSTLELKLSPDRSGGDVQIVQDTGSGGSYPVSTDRVAWALGSRALYRALADPTAHAARALDAIANTLEQDRVAVFDAVDGLYRGEHSFLDWREQSYAPWTAQDTAHIAMSKALSTNVLHLEALRYAAALATDANDPRAARYAGWADALATRIHERFWLAEDGGWSSHIPTTLDTAPARRFDLLGTSLAVLAGIGDEAARTEAITNYPHLVRGPPVMWPESNEVPIYHNRAIWPFVTAYGMRAAKQVGAAEVVTHVALSLYDGAALNLSNMENLEVESGLPWVEDGGHSGPVVNSQRQLWSVAAFFTLVHETVFGVTPVDGGLDFAPGLTRALRRTWFEGTSVVALSALPFRGARFSVQLELPESVEDGDAMLEVEEVLVNGVAVAPPLVPADGDVISVVLKDNGAKNGALRLVTDGAIFAPPTPSISAIVASPELTLTLQGGTNAATWSIYRDGVRVATGLPGTNTSYTDPGTSAASPSHCYTAELVVDGRASHRSNPACWWGPAFERTASIDANAFTAVGGSLVFNHGRSHYEAWGDSGHALEATYTAARSGEHLVQLSAGNGAGPVDTGITCGIKRVRVETMAGAPVAEGYAVMPHLGDWSVWRDGSFVAAQLQAGETYRIVVDMDAFAVNMSERRFFERYTGGSGGSTGAFFRVNIDQIKVLARGP